MQSLTVSGQRLEYELLGEGPLVVLVNNPGVSTVGQRLMANPLVKAGRQVLIFENHGPDSATMPEFVDALAGLLDALNLRSVHLWGWSQGAIIIQELAVARPDLTGRLGLLGTAGRSTAFLRMFSKAWSDALAPSVEGGASIGTVMFALGLWPPAILANDDLFAALTANPAPPEVTRRAALAAAAYEGRLNELEAISAPTLVIGFELDVLIPAVLGREVADAMKNARYVEIPGATHGGPFTHTSEIMEVALPFLNEEQPASA